VNVINLHGEGLCYDFFHWVQCQMSIFDGFVNWFELIFKILNGLLLFFIIIDLLLLLLFALLNFLTLLSALLFYWLSELDIYGYLIEFTEVARNGNLNDWRVVFEIEKQLVQVNIHACRSGIEKYKIFLDLAYPAYGGLQDFLNVYTFLRMHHLIVALLQLSVDIYVLYIQRSQVLEDLIWGPGVDQLQECYYFMTFTFNKDFYLRKLTSTPASFLSEGKFSILTYL